jgi:riboflavin synthase
VLERRPEEHWTVVRVSLPDGLGRYVVEKGSITIDGVSLTVTAVADDWLEVSLIPTTLGLTTLGSKQAGALVNLEVDVLAKHVEKLLLSGVVPGSTPTGESA